MRIVTLGGNHEKAMKSRICKYGNTQVSIIVIDAFCSPG